MTDFKIGEIVRITGPEGGSNWVGLRCEVADPSRPLALGFTRLQPLSERPDGGTRCQFYWPTSDLAPDAESPAVKGWGECSTIYDEARRTDPDDSQGHSTGRALARGERMDEYGHPSESFGRIAELWSTYLEGIDYEPAESLLAQDVAKMMILLKVSRSITDTKPDTLDDIEGYIECLRMLQDNERGLND